MTLSLRLQAIVSLVTPNSVVLDVASDHALVPIELIKRGIIKRAYASDISFAAVKRMIKNSADLPIKSYVDDGISLIKPDVTSLVIAGIGSSLIISILQKNSDKLINVDEIIIDSHRDIPLIRHYLTEHNYYIDEEIPLFEKKHFYEIIKFKKGQRIYSSDDFLLGPIIKMKKEYLKKKIEFLFDLDRNLVKNNAPQEVIGANNDLIRRYQLYAD